jgi:isopenicillin-N epimerase
MRQITPDASDNVRMSIRFGHTMRDAWMLDPAVTYLNHGTVGATPRRVLETQRRLRDEVERQPSRFLLRELSSTRVGVDHREPGRLRHAAEAVGRHIGAAGADLVFVDNATAGINAVLGSMDLVDGDEISVTDLAYGAILNAAAYTARKTRARVVTTAMPFPATALALADAFEKGLTSRTRIAIVDHVTSESALLMPIADIAARCRARGILVLIDGAHAPGSVPVDIASLGVDFYAANLHKWAWAPRSCGILWVAPAHQERMHPPVISWGLDSGFTSEFDWVGTRDPTPALSAPDAWAYMAELGIERVRDYNHSLAWEAARYLTSRWGTPLSVMQEQVGTMVTLPLPPRFGRTKDQADRLRDALLFEDRIEAQVHACRDSLWLRVSAQIYNEMADVDELATAIDRRGRSPR